MRRKVLVVLLLAIISVIAIPQVVLAGSHKGHDDSLQHDDRNQNGHKAVAFFNVRLAGSEQVPVVNASSFGHARFRLLDNNTLMFSLVVCNIANVTLAHIHVGAAGTNGPPVLPFFDERAYPFSVAHGCVTLVAGIRTPADLVPHPEAGINTWSDFLNALLTNRTYVNVHTTAHTGGEIRGQLILKAGPGHDHEDQSHVEHDDADDDE